jgi:RND family efflux transporter MFP subunit
MMRKYVLPAGVILLSVVIAATLMATSPKLEPSNPEPVALSIHTLIVNSERVRLIVNSQGTVNPRIESNLVPESSGRVVWMSPSLVSGGYFEKDQPLLRIDDADYRTATRRAQANMRRNQAEQEHARFEYKRLQSLEARKLVSRSQLENALRITRIADAVLEESQAALQQSRLDLSRTQIKAPFTGLVRSKQVDLGEFVTRGSIIARIYASDYVEVRLPIADRQLAYLGLPRSQRGRLPEDRQLDVTLKTSYGGSELAWVGKIVRAEAEIDAKSRMLNVVARVENNDPDNLLTVGMFVQAEITGTTAEGVYVLPRIALRTNDEVLVVDANNHLRSRTISILRLYQDQALIKSGLTNGDIVSISPIQTFIEGMSVNPVE